MPPLAGLHHLRTTFYKYVAPMALRLEPVETQLASPSGFVMVNIRLLLRQIRVQLSCCAGKTPAAGRNLFMQTEIAEDVITQKTRELCEVIISQPGFESSHQRIEAFMADEKARSLYE